MKTKLEVDRSPYYLAGPGRIKGMNVYMNPVTGRQIEVIAGNVIDADRTTLRVAVNSAGLVSVPQAALNGSGPAFSGDAVLVGDVRPTAAGHVARYGWLVDKPSVSNRRRGVFVVVDLPRIYIRDDVSGQFLPTYQSEIAAGTPIKIDTPVTYFLKAGRAVVVRKA